MRVPKSLENPHRVAEKEGKKDILPDTGHFLHLERPQEVNQRIVAFLQAG